MSAKIIKRLFDLLLSIMAGVFAIPIVAVTMLIIRIADPKDSAIFKQTRIGYKCKPFTIYKLRTMTNEKDGNGELLPYDDRLKMWGKIIRKLSIDELTQIINIIKGEMSWIGPRPLLPEEMLVMTEEEQWKRQSVIPGITGWEAINEKNNDNRRKMAEYDLFYVDNWSFGLDTKIFFLTIKKLLTADRVKVPELDEDEFRSVQVVGKE